MGPPATQYGSAVWLYGIRNRMMAQNLTHAFGVQYITPQQAGGEASANKCPECGLDVRDHPKNDECSYRARSEPEPLPSGHPALLNAVN